ncbi:ABC transporter permease [Prosthecodimorpha staleyi]|uniref:ABC transporter permease n=1 Tax=Prosthecodimorpha staleyi TaxID=2840188 RepID=A0A947D8S6_9HYPH|nr:ABC transporter permease [Prosthecodimorpha staleyi]MBT9290122.1 ABC transporter permease [Prosthecodimorpha staleyi]
MRKLVDAYGAGITTILLLLVAIWTLGMVIAPQATMLDQSLWSLERGTVDLTVEIDRTYNELSTAKYDYEHSKDAEARLALDVKIQGLTQKIAELELKEKQPDKVYGLQNYTRMTDIHLQIFMKTIFYAVMVTLLALVVCYPVAYMAALASSGLRATLLLLALVIPYALNELLRIYAWLMILDYQGVINGVLEWFGITDLAARRWIPFLESPAAVFMAMVYTYVLFMVFPIYNTLETLDRNQIEAARDLGASVPRIHARVIIPHAKPGIAVGCIMTFMLSAGSYSVPQIMTRGQGGDWFSQLVYRQFFEANNWNIGAAYAFSLLAACMVFVFLVMTVFGIRLKDIAR